MVFEEIEGDSKDYSKFEYTDEDIEAIFSNIEGEDYEEAVDSSIEWRDMELQHINYHISKSRAKGKKIYEIKAEEEEKKRVLEYCKDWFDIIIGKNKGD